VLQFVPEICQARSQICLPNLKSTQADINDFLNTCDWVPLEVKYRDISVFTCRHVGGLLPLDQASSVPLQIMMVARYTFTCVDHTNVCLNCAEILLK
jgi:hypothetical protein